VTLEELTSEVESGAIDTVIVAFTDMQGRLMGKRLHAEFFLEGQVAEHGVEGCNYLLALEMEMDPVPGYGIASWEQGYGDFGLRPEMDTLRGIPWLEATALVLCDVVWHDGSPVNPSPRQVLKRQVERAAELGFEPMVGARVLPPEGELRGSPREALPGADAVGPLHPRLPHPRHDLRRAAHPPDP
jgi:glutamine synthetase